jgi:CMP-N,N'-diacetyllegionaminic acid synthase
MTKQGGLIAMIPARGGSKGLPGKNARLFAGKPLIAHAILLAQQCPEVERIVVSTDSPEIAATARAYGAEVPFMRPPELALDDTPLWPVLRHALAAMDAAGAATHTVVLLDPTAPCRLPEDVRAAYARLSASPEADGVIGVSKQPYNPIWYSVVERDGWMADLIPGASAYSRRQDVPPVYRINGTLYFWRAEFMRAHADDWRRHGKYLIHETPDDISISIDTLEQFEQAERLVRSGRVRLPWLAEGR